MKSLGRLLREWNVLYKTKDETHHAGKNWIQVNCPWCDMGRNKFHLGLHVSGKAGHCWVCGKRSPVEALRLLTGQSRRIIGQALSTVNPEVVLKTKRGKYEEPEGLRSDKKKIIRYLENRGFWNAKTVVEAFQLKFWEKHWRIFIPILTAKGNEASWTSRAMGEEVKPRYLSAHSHQETTPHKSLLYGEWLLPNRRAIVVVEGPTDVWRAYGTLPVVGLFGVQFSEEQAAKLLDYRNIVLALDNDLAGEKAVNRLQGLLQGYGHDRVYRLLPYTDMGDEPYERLDLAKKSLEGLYYL